MVAVVRPRLSRWPPPLPFPPLEQFARVPNPRWQLVQVSPGAPPHHRAPRPVARFHPATTLTEHPHVPRSSDVALAWARSASRGPRGMPDSRDGTRRDGGALVARRDAGP